MASKRGLHQRTKWIMQPLAARLDDSGEFFTISENGSDLLWQGYDERLEDRYHSMVDLLRTLGFKVEE